MNRTKSLCLLIAVLTALILFCSCGSAQSSEQGGNLSEMKTVEEVLAETPAEDLVGKNDVMQFTTPFYSTQIQYNEGFLLREDGLGGTLPVKLMFPVAHVLEVRSNDLQTLYEEGKDYTIENGSLVIPAGSAMKAMPDSEFFLPEGTASDWLYNDRAGEDEGRAVTTDKAVLYRYRYVITYIRTEVYSGHVLQSKADRLTHFSQSAKEGGSVEMLFVGDSIGEGAGGSGNFLGLADLTARAIEARTGAKVTLSNCSVGGIDSLEFVNVIDGRFDQINPNIVNKARDRYALMEQKKSFADIVFIALGANDSSADRAADIFKIHIQALIDYFRDANPDVSVVVVSSPEINDKIRRNKPGDTRNLRLHDLGEYAEVLSTLEEEYDNLAFADIHTAQASVLECKYLEDIIADNLNHPSDYMSRLYVQFLIQTIF